MFRVVSILSRTGGQTIPRPFSSASTLSEMEEILRHYVLATKSTIIHIKLANIETETPILVTVDGDGVAREFFAFYEN